MNDPSDKVINYTEVSYDIENGELVTIEDVLGSTTRDIVRVRAELQEKALRQAVVEELRRLGYTIVPPEAEEPA